MYLSHGQLEEIAVTVTNDFNKGTFGDEDIRERKMPRATQIDKLATEYLGLDVSYTHLSTDGSLCGITAYCDTEYIIDGGDCLRSIPLKRNQVLLDDSFIQEEQIHKMCGKRRFTLAHECAHQILFQMESDASKSAFRKQYSERKAYSLRELKTHEDWNEWQANVLGAAILMPQSEIDFALWRLTRKQRFTSYDGIFNSRDKQELKQICEYFKVSKSALIIRLTQLGYIEKRPYSYFYEPLEGWR